ncbi:hypothetical protein [Humisphaera borealis]|uniref:Uncharacterized protein n=1 Tax=Humisphaera borealis TaxID=2807512 RepID=A0A7M2WVT1_9BACT|nr:hypothetical protein [Humisphaera borealis]QOV89332.1 hypothetical protein IPV69_24510 [Humisphaera borealis]
MKQVWTILLLIVSAGCAGKKTDPGVPIGADLLTEIVTPARPAADQFTSLELPEDGALFVFNATRQKMVYTAAVKTGDVVKLSWGGVNLVGRLPSKSNYKPAYERQVARYEAGHTYRVYYKPGEPVVIAEESSALTRPFDAQERIVNPLDKPK